MPISNGIFGMPLIASEGIQVMDVTDDSTRIGPPRLARPGPGSRVPTTNATRTMRQTAQSGNPKLLVRLHAPRDAHDGETVLTMLRQEVKQAFEQQARSEERRVGKE